MNAMKDAVVEQKKQMEKVDIDKMMDVQDEMMGMKFETEYMNEMMNRNYDVDVDEDELDDELMEFEREIAREKKNVQVKKNVEDKKIDYLPGSKNINFQ